MIYVPSFLLEFRMKLFLRGAFLNKEVFLAKSYVRS